MTARQYLNNTVNVFSSQLLHMSKCQSTASTQGKVGPFLFWVLSGTLGLSVLTNYPNNSMCILLCKLIPQFLLSVVPEGNRS